MPPKRLIVPVKEAAVTVTAGTGFVDVASFSGTITLLVVEGPSGAKGRIKVRDMDETQDIYRDPRGTPNVSLEFYSQAVRLPINGPARITLDGVSIDGTYTIYYVLEERPQRV